MAEKASEVCKVTPPPGSPSNIIVPLTIFDLFWLRFPPAGIRFFYEVPYQEPHMLGFITPKFKHSVSLTLQNFLPLSGNILWPSSSPNPVIHYKEGDGVLLTVCVSDADFYHLSSKNIRECKIFRQLSSCIVGSDSKVPVIAIKVTLFPNKGFCIDIKANHGVFDGKSLTLFIKSWASISKFSEISTGLHSEITPKLERKAIRQQYAEIEYSFIELLKQNGTAQNSLAIREYEPLPDGVRGTFRLSGLDVKKLKELIRGRVPYVSTFTVTYAYTILCIVRARKSTKNNKVFVGFPADIRGRLEPRLPANYFGNCIAYCDAILDSRELFGKEGMGVIADFVSKSIKDLESGVLKRLEQWLPNAFRKYDTDGIIIFCVGSSRYRLEHIDFGWGKPRKMDITSIDKPGAISFIELGDGGIEIDLSLNKNEMERFSHVFAQGVDKIMKHSAAL